MSQRPVPAERHENPALLATNLRIVLGQLVRRLREQSTVGDLTKSQEAVLLRLQRDGSATATELARAEGMRPQSMAKIVQALVEAGLLIGAADPSDGRRTLLTLTETARDHFRTGQLAKDDWLTRAILNSLTPEEVDLLAASVPSLRRLSQYP
ncbi:MULTISPECIES: MarR family winged helix-turn-helix transcriptional regulator [Streptomyces]|uniref:MarR family winged helix-turn-helix transcriptional regulator n=1 Tax=Streptomyces TaxID=1883 RepID=UPI0023DD21EA|nr:MarR family transcriptional regulator [Streptomyces sp. FXJ1.172]WEP00528.1 MarR family transcriptional regulator [Streptomyces sp. FXJ1.172]